MQPEWFYKGDGSVVVKPGGSFLSPKFALDGSEEPECVGLYVVSDEGVPFRVGYVRNLAIAALRDLHCVVQLKVRARVRLRLRLRLRLRVRGVALGFEG